MVIVAKHEGIPTLKTSVFYKTKCELSTVNELLMLVWLKA